jgi:hypothetical protein
MRANKFSKLIDCGMDRAQTGQTSGLSLLQDRRSDPVG